MRAHRHIVSIIVPLFLAAGCGEEQKAECGNDRVDSGEVCDGTDMDGQNCQDHGFLGGTLRCTADCSAVVFDQCSGGCGNNRAEGEGEGLAEEEPCDGYDLRGKNCNVEGYELGTVSCLPDCSGFDTSECYNPTCGDGVVEGHEECEPGVELSTTCVGLMEGYNEGDLACHPVDHEDECMYDKSGCVIWECGNEVVEGLEQCDGANLDEETCVTLGYDEGDLACHPPEHDEECRYDVEGCVEWECGDGSVDGEEDCEPGVDITASCVDEGFAGGDPLGCIAVDEPGECTFDYDNCTGGCGNNVVETTADGAPFDEVCDGTDMAGQTCESLGAGFVGGELGCLSTCNAYDTSACVSA